MWRKFFAGLIFYLCYIKAIFIHQSYHGEHVIMDISSATIYIRSLTARQTLCLDFRTKMNVNPQIRSIEVVKSVLTMGGHGVVACGDFTSPLLNEAGLASLCSQACRMGSGQATGAAAARRVKEKAGADILRKKRENPDVII